MAIWQPRVHLVDWTILCRVAAIDENDWAAQSETEWRFRRAMLTFPPDFYSRTRCRGIVHEHMSDDQLAEETVLHELLHIAEQPLASQLTTEIEWYAGRANHEANGVIGAELRNGWRDYREYWINHVTRLLLEAYTPSTLPAANGAWTLKPVNVAP